MRKSTQYDQSECNKNEHTFAPKIASKTHASWKEDEYELQLAEQELMKFYRSGRSGLHKMMVGIIHPLVFPQSKYKF